VLLVLGAVCLAAMLLVDALVVPGGLVVISIGFWLAGRGMEQPPRKRDRFPVAPPPPSDEVRDEAWRRERERRRRLASWGGHGSG
jgi:hypothetical protein